MSTNFPTLTAQIKTNSIIILPGFQWKLKIKGGGKTYETIILIQPNKLHPAEFYMRLKVPMAPIDYIIGSMKTLLRNVSMKNL